MLINVNLVKTNLSAKALNSSIAYYYLRWGQGELDAIW